MTLSSIIVRNPSTVTPLCAHLLAFVLGQVRLELEVGLEFAGAELALVGAVYHDDLFAVSLALLALDGLRLNARVLVTRGLPLAAPWVASCYALLTLPWNFCNGPSSVKSKDGCI